MKPVAVIKKRGQRTWLHPKKGIQKPTKAYKKYLGKVYGQAQQDQSHCALDVLIRQNICIDGFRLIASEAARLSHCRSRNNVTRRICSALTELYPARCQEPPVRDGLGSDLVAYQS